jgi:hypothetical protein
VQYIKKFEKLTAYGSKRRNIDVFLESNCKSERQTQTSDQFSRANYERSFYDPNGVDLEF